MARATSPVSGTTTPASVFSSFGIAFMTDCLVLRRSLRRRGAAQPGVEPDRADPWISPGDQGPVIQLGAEIAGVYVRGDLPGIVPGSEEATDERVELELLRTRHLERAVRRISERDIGQRR